MASFGAHVAVGLTASGLAATSALAAGLATPSEMLALMGLGTLGSLLPDLDADNSAPVQIAFTLASIVLAFAVMFLLARTPLSVAELVAVWLVAYLSIRWLVFAVFTRLTTHRGLFHSVPAAVLSGLLTTLVAARVLGQPAFQAWMAGGFLAFGYLVHLGLDEVYSVNLFGVRPRRSLGSALKLWAGDRPFATALLYGACGAALLLAPHPGGFWEVIAAAETRAQIRQRLVPEGGWFAPLRRPRADGAPPASRGLP
jgi:hypothetical protein